MGGWSQFKIDCTTTFSLFSHACVRTGRFSMIATLFLSCEWQCSVPTLQVVLSFQGFDFITVLSIFVPMKFRKPRKGVLRRGGCHFDQVAPGSTCSVSCGALVSEHAVIEVILSGEDDWRRFKINILSSDDFRIYWYASVHDIHIWVYITYICIHIYLSGCL